MDNSANQHSLLIDILKLKENQNVNIFLEKILSLTDENFKENFNISVKHKLESTSKKLIFYLLTH